MKSIYFGIIALFLLGFILSLYLVLSPEDYALMLLKGKKYTDAEQYYKNKYAQGDRSAATLIPLKTLEIARGDNDAAIKSLEEYLKAQPNDLHALKLLGVLYLNSQQRPRYLLNLERIKQLTPTEQVLQELATWYHSNGDKQKEEQILKEILNKGIGKPQHFTALAYLLASKHDYQSAFQLMQNRRKQFPQAVDFVSLEFEIALLIQLGKETADRNPYDTHILELARAFILHTQEDKNVLDLVASLRNQKRDDLAFLLIPDLYYFGKKNLEIQTNIIELEWNQGSKERAYQELLDVYTLHSLNAKLADLFTRIALEKDFFLIIDDLLDHIQVEALSETTLLWVAVVAAKNKDLRLANKTEKKLQKHFLSTHPVVQLALELSKGDVQGEQKLQNFLKNHVIASSYALSLMRLAFYNGYKAAALDIGSHFVHFNQMSPEELISWALIYTELNEASIGLDILHKHQHEIQKSRDAQALALLNAALGNSESVTIWLGEQQHLDKNFLINLYLLADKSKSYPLALTIAKHLYETYCSLTIQLYYASALLNNSQCEEALILFHDLLQKKPTFQVKMGYLKALIACKQDNQKELSVFLHQLLSDPLSEIQLRDIGYLILEKLDDFHLAENIFWQLVKKKNPLSSDIETLLYLVGPRPPEHMTRFIKEYAKKAPDHEKIKWIKALQNIGEYEAAFHLFMHFPTTAWSKDEYLLWIQLLTQLNDIDSVKNALPFADLYLTEVSDLEKIAQLAESYGMLNLQWKLLDILICKQPHNPVFWKNIGKVAYNLADYTSAFHYFNTYFSFDHFDKDYYAILFFYGEMLSIRNDWLRAKDYYLASLEMLYQTEQKYPCNLQSWNFNCAKSPDLVEIKQEFSRQLTFNSLNSWGLDPDMRAVQAILFARLKYKWLGAKELEALYFEEPNPSARAAWANLLMERGHLKAARYVLYDLCDCPCIKGSTFLVEWEKPIDATAAATENGILITTSLPIESSNLQQSATQLPSGVKGIEAGHHSFLIITDSPAEFSLSIERNFFSNHSSFAFLDNTETAGQELSYQSETAEDATGIAKVEKTNADALHTPYLLRVQMRLYPDPFPPSLALGLARATLAFRERNYVYARYLATELTRCYPDNVDVLSLNALIEDATGRWQRGMSWLANAHMTAPCNENVWVAFRQMYFPNASFIGFEREAMLTHATAAEQIYRLQGEWVLSRNCFRFSYFGFKAEIVRAHISDIVTETGLVEGFLGNRWRGQFKNRIIDSEGMEFEYSAYMGNGVIGAGVRWLKRFDQGNVFIYADWNKPFWDILECLVFEGTENRSTVGGRYIFNARFDSLAAIGFRQYGEKRARHAINTIKIEGVANYNLTLKDPFFVLNYTLDAEYVVHILEKIDTFGALYQPVPLDSRENHTLRLMIRTIWHRWWTVGGFFGETFNRLGTHNFTAGINFHYFSPCGFEFDFIMERYPSTTVLGEQVDDIRGGMNWRF